MRLFFRFLVFLAVTWSFAIAPQARAEAPNGWILKQTSDEYGILTSQVTSKSLRLDTPELTVLLLPPKYGLYIFNRKNKRFIEEPVENFNVHTKPNAITPNIRLDKEVGVTICGVKADKYLCVDTRHGNKRARFEFLATKNLNVPDKLSDACMIFFSIPEMTPGHGMPLSATRLSASGGRFDYVTTRSIKRAYIAPEKFVKPKGYTRVDNFVALSSDAENIPAPKVHDLDYLMEDSKKH